MFRQQVMEKDPIMKALATSADGHIYGLPAKKPCRPIISNQVLKAFAEQDANGNGDPTDEIPYSGGYADAVMFFCLPFGTTLGSDNTYSMTIRDGAPVFLPTSDMYKEGLIWMRKCYEEGLIDKELFTQDDSMKEAKLTSEVPIVGAAAGWTSDSTFRNNAGAYAALPALQGPDGDRYVASDVEHANYSRNEFLITTACKDPAALLQWIDGFYTDDASIQTFYGTFGVGIEATDSGYTVLAPPDGESADIHAWVNSLRDFGPKYVDDDFNAKVTYEEQNNGDAIKLQMDEELKQYAIEAYPNVSYTADELNTLSTLYVDISAYTSSVQATWITEGGIEEGWDNYISTLKQMGYDNFMQIQTDAYNRYQESMK